MEFVPPEKCNKQQCKDMIDYFLTRNSTETVIKYTKRLYEVVCFEADFLTKGKANG